MINNIIQLWFLDYLLGSLMQPKDGREGAGYLNDHQGAWFVQQHIVDTTKFS